MGRLTATARVDSREDRGVAKEAPQSGPVRAAPRTTLAPAQGAQQ
jgi:hypothetical protein